MRAVRIYLKPNAETFIDMGVQDGFNMAAWWYSLRKDGAALAQGAVVPIETIHHVALTEVAEAPANFTVLPGGKLN
jgi:hypothetical protein